MTEFVLALPLLATVLALMFLTGWLHMRKQRVAVTSRYAVWRSIDSGWVAEEALNETGLNNRAVSVDQTPMIGSVVATLPAWIDAAADEGVSAGALADELIWRTWPLDTQVRLTAVYDPPLAVGGDFADDVNHRHGRAGRPWVRGEASPWAALRSMYYRDLDIALDGHVAAGDDMAGRIRGLYRWDW